MDNFEISVDEVLSATPGKMICGPLCTFSGISTDTRLLGHGQLFVAIPGKNYDGHDFVQEAREKGALGALVSRDPGFEDDDFAVIKVADTRKALLDIAGWWRAKFPHAITIGVTGTNGKTTTKDMLRWLLSAIGPTVAAIRSYNNDIGVALTLLEMRSFHRYAVVEMGASAQGEIAPLAKAAAPMIGVVTNIGLAHMEGFRSASTIVKTKSELLKALPKDRDGAFAVLNADDPYFKKLRDACKVPVITFAVDNKDADVRPEEVVEQTAVTWFTVDGVETSIPLGGRHNLYNALAALAVVKGLDLDLARSARRLKGFSPPPMRSNVFHVGPVTIISDCFNANPSSLAAALDYFDKVPSPNKVFVLGDMLELGSSSAKHHKEAGERLAKSSVDVLLTVGDKAAKAAGPFAEAGKRTFPFEPDQRSAAAEKLFELLEGGGAVMFKGSRALRLEDLVSLFIRTLKRNYAKDRK